MEKKARKNALFIYICLFLVSVVIVFMLSKKDSSYFIMDNKKKSSDAVIKQSTQMIYEYHYKKDNCNETIKEDAPHFLIGMNETKTKNFFRDWIVKDFSSEKVTLKKDIDGVSNQHYIVTIQDGYVAVFYQNPVNGERLKEVTEMPVNSLSKSDRKHLETGIKVIGDDKLIKVLQDYES